MAPSRVAPRVLLVSYAFPPIGGAGVQRATKFVKYLPCFGWTPSVLAPSNASMPMLDSSLRSDIPGDTLIRRTRTFEPSYAVKNLVSAASAQPGSRVPRARNLVRAFLRRLLIGILQPDPQVLWYPTAVREGRRLLNEVPHAAILATGPPFSSFLIGSALHRASGLPLVLDYRDEWGLTNECQENKEFGTLARWLNGWLERAVVRRASALVATTMSSADGLGRIVRDAEGHACVACIPNGFDPDDFTSEEPPQPRGDYYRLVYAGTLWNLTSVAPLVEAITLFCRRSPELAARLEVVFVGRKTADQQHLLSRLAEQPVRIVDHRYVDHNAALVTMRSADLLCALLTDRPGAGRVLPGKIFEYMACRRPILAIAPRGDLWRVLDDYPSSHRCLPSDIDGIAGVIGQNVQAFITGSRETPIAWDGHRYNRRYQAKALADLLSKVTAPATAFPVEAEEVDRR